MSAYCVPRTLHHEGGWSAEGGPGEEGGISVALCFSASRGEVGVSRSALCCITKAIYVLFHHFIVWTFYDQGPFLTRLRKGYSEIAYLTFSVQNTDALYLQMADVNSNVESKSSKKDVFLWSLSNRPKIYFPDAIIFQFFFWYTFTVFI